MISASADDMVPEEIAYGTSRWVRVRRVGLVYFLEARQADGNWGVIGVAKGNQEPPGWKVGVGAGGFVGGPSGDRHDALVGLLEANKGVLDAWKKDKEQGPGPLGSFGGAARPGSGVA